MELADVSSMCRRFDSFAFYQTERQTVAETARHAGMSPNTLQRLFHLFYGRTVFDYVRMRKLQRAREALERDGVTVSEAAYIAGYTSAANFATPFKRAFGPSPKTFRTSV